MGDQGGLARRRVISLLALVPVGGLTAGGTFAYAVAHSNKPHHPSPYVGGVAVGLFTAVVVCVLLWFFVYRIRPELLRLREAASGLTREQKREIRRSNFAGRAVGDPALAPAAVAQADWLNFGLGPRWTIIAAKCMVAVGLLGAALGLIGQRWFDVAVGLFLACAMAGSAFMIRGGQTAEKLNRALVGSSPPSP